MSLNTIHPKVICVLLFIVYLTAVSAQSPYALNLKQDISLYAAGTLTQASAIFISSKIDGLTPDQLAALDASSISRFDRKAIGFDSRRARIGSDILLNSSYAFPFLFLINKNSRKDFTTIGIMAGEALLINASLTTLSKVTIKRTRPLAYNTSVDLDKRTSKSARFSFYSGHTSTVAVLSFFSAKVYNDYHPDSKWKPVIWSAAAIIPAASGYFRVKGGKHFPTDVITGYAAGALIGYLIPHIHKKKDHDQKVGFHLSSGGNTIGLNLTW